MDQETFLSSQKTAPVSGQQDLTTYTQGALAETALLQLETSVPEIPNSETEKLHLARLQQFCHDKDALVQAGYIMQTLTEDDLAQKRKCWRCHKFIHKARKDEREKKVQEPVSTRQTASACAVADQNLVEKSTLKSNKQECRFHDGATNHKTWSCCRQGIYGSPCKTAAEHITAEYLPGELAQHYAYHITPSPQCPSHRVAVAIDCEMGTSTTNESVLIRITLIDYFTSAILVDKLVYPEVPLLHSNPRFSGVTYGQLVAARRKRQCLFGTAAARNAIWKYVGPDTIVVAHSGQNDLISLRWIHGRMVDTYLVSTLIAKQKTDQGAQNKAGKTHEPDRTDIEGLGENPKPGLGIEDDMNETAKKPLKQKRVKGTGQFALKTLAKKLLSREIQTSKHGHDSVEDAVATRDIAYWHVVNFLKRDDFKS